MKTKIKWLAIILLILVALIAILGRDKKPETPSESDVVKSRTINILEYENPKDASDLKTVKIATVLVAKDGRLTLTILKPDYPTAKKLSEAITEISARPTLDLTSESEKIINGHSALVMMATKIPKTDTNYIYAVRETLAVEFGFGARMSNE